MDWNTLKQTRYEGITEQIDYYAWCKHLNGKLSKAQKEHLTELRNTVCVFGNGANDWVNLCNELLND